jgi:FkbM family methyltransferase
VNRRPGNVSPVGSIVRLGAKLLNRGITEPAVQQRPAPAERFAAEDVLELIYEGAPSEAIANHTRGILEGEPIGSLGAIRRVLAANDRQVAPSRLSVRFNRSDVQIVELEGFRLVLDRADRSVSYFIIAEGSWEPRLTAVFRRYIKPGQTVIDVGANVGYFTMLASTIVGATGRVFAVEPNSENCRLILASSAENAAANITLLPFALSDRPGWSAFGTHIGSNGGLQNFDNLIDDAPLVVPTFPLDHVVDGPVHFMKIDIEGAEGLAMQGAQRIVDQHRPIITSEFSIDMLNRVSGMSPTDYLALFTDRGYRLHVLDRTTGEPVEHESAESLLHDWGSDLRIEDLLFLP